VPGRDLPPVMRIWQDQIEVVTAPDGFALEGGSYLLRPDGYVAARGSAANPGNLVSYLRLLFGSRTTDVIRLTGQAGHER
jgi:hypothetical protein